ncbi:hypothetical protein K1719_014474 [Acacia pycnantha]|nr:hypothetical protein K1719_014474 [Acacia pycnantha]
MVRSDFVILFRYGSNPIQSMRPFGKNFSIQMSSDSLPQTSIVVRPAVSISLSSHFLLSSFTSILFAAEMEVSVCIWDAGQFQWIFWQLLPLILSQVQGGGNAADALTCVACLGLKPRLISKVADDAQGKGILDELKVDGVDTSFMVVFEWGTSPFTYIIVDSQTKTRACIHTPGHPPMALEELSVSSLLAALDGVRIVYFDVRLHETALVIARKAVRKGIPILIDVERLREGLDR